MNKLNTELLTVCTNPTCRSVGAFPPVTVEGDFNPQDYKSTSNQLVHTDDSTISREITIIKKPYVPGEKPVIEKLIIKQAFNMICLKCGKETARVKPGVYLYDNDTHHTQLLEGPPETHQAINQLKNLIQLIELQPVSKEQIISEVEKISPAIAQISRQTASTTDYTKWIALILSLLNLLNAIYLGNFKKDSKSDVSQEFIDHLLKENESLINKKAAYTQRVSMPQKMNLLAKKINGVNKSEKNRIRNGMCSCKSGKRFLKCHGQKQAK